MPNWTANNLVLTPTTDDQRVLLAKIIENPENLFNSLRPMPETVFRGNLGVAEREYYGANNWYDWSIAHWGTKWDVKPWCWTALDDGKAVFDFDSAWNPPIELYNWLVQQGWGVRASYYEPGMAFAGIYEDGTDRCYEELDDEFFDSDDGVELDDYYNIQASMLEIEE